MPRRRKQGTSGFRVDNVAISFYNTKLKYDAVLRQACSDRHILDDAIDRWKDGERLDGCPIKGVARSSIIHSLKWRWKLIDSKVGEENVIIWKVDVEGNDKANRIARIVEKIRNARTDLETNQNGIIINKFEWEDRVYRLGERLTQCITIRNESDIEVLCTIKCDAAMQQGFSIDGALKFPLNSGSSQEIVVSFLARTMGVKKSLLVFEFESIDFDEGDSMDVFSIARYIFLRVGDPDDYDLLKASSPYVKAKTKYYDSDKKFTNPVRVNSTGGWMTPFVTPLSKYSIPPEVENLIVFEKETFREMFDGMFRGEAGGFVDARYEKVDYSSYLNTNNYATCMQHLLWLEEAQMRVDIKSYDLINVPLMRDGRAHYKLFVPGLAESRPSVLKGDKILIYVKGGSKFEGVVNHTSQEYAIMNLPKTFNHIFIDGLCVDVRFTFSRTTLRTSHQALATLISNDEGSQLSRTLFPTSMDRRALSAVNTCIIRASQLKFYNRTLNPEQQTAVIGIVQSVARPAPYLIYGPPGTGKTVTLVESILQTLLAVGSNPDTRILICAPSNTAVDVVVERLSTVVTKREMLRIVAFSRDKATVPDQIIGYTNYNREKDCFISPVPDSIKNFKIVAITTSYAGRLPNIGIMDHFTHVFIDEAGHSVEPEALGCLALALKQCTSNPPVTVLAGDPKQLGPIIRSDIAKLFGFEKSLLERLSELEPYARSEETDSFGYQYDKNMITKLVRNYRSHKRVLDIPNNKFYDGDLIAAADITISHRFVDWEHLPNRGFPIIFHGVEGEDMREANSPSWFNPDEAQYVKMYVELLVKETKKNRCKPEDIGIITPYHRQVQKIRKILDAHGYGGCKVGSVEEYQGSERPVIIISTVRSTVDFIQFDQKHKVCKLISLCHHVHYVS